MNQAEVLKQQFLSSGSLLAITREYERELPCLFDLILKDNTRLSFWDTGVLMVEPEQVGDCEIVISSGIHGNETAPIEITEQLISDIVSGKTKVANRVLFIIGNPVSMNIGKRFEVENMNRLFCGKHEGKNHYEAHRAAQLESYLKRFFQCDEKQRYHFDLHTAIRASKYPKFAIYPYPDGKNWDKQQLGFFLASDINTILFGHQPSGTFSYYSSHTFSAHAVTVELGKVKQFGENDLVEFTAMTSNLRSLIEGKDIVTKPFNNDDFNLFQVQLELVKKSEQAFKLNIAGDVENFTDFEAGFQLTEDSDGGYKVQQSGEAIVFPNASVPVGQRAGLVVQKTQI